MYSSLFYCIYFTNFYLFKKSSILVTWSVILTTFGACTGNHSEMTIKNIQNVK